MEAELQQPEAQPWAFLSWLGLQSFGFGVGGALLSFGVECSRDFVIPLVE